MTLVVESVKDPKAQKKYEGEMKRKEKQAADKKAKEEKAALANAEFAAA